MKRSRKWPNSQQHELKRCLDVGFIFSLFSKSVVTCLLFFSFFSLLFCPHSHAPFTGCTLLPQQLIRRDIHQQVGSDNWQSHCLTNFTTAVVLFTQSSAPERENILIPRQRDSLIISVKREVLESRRQRVDLSLLVRFSHHLFFLNAKTIYTVNCLMMLQAFADEAALRSTSKHQQQSSDMRRTKK